MVTKSYIQDTVQVRTTDPIRAHTHTHTTRRWYWAPPLPHVLSGSASRPPARLMQFSPSFDFWQMDIDVVM